MSERKSFVFHAEWKQAIDLMPTELRLELYEAIVTYAITGELPEMTEQAKVAFCFIQPKLDESNKAYLVKCEKIKENGKKGGRPKKETEENQKNQTKPNGFSKTKQNQKNQMVLKEEQEKRSKKEIEENILTEKEEKDNNYIIIQKEEKNFDSVFGKFCSELLGEFNELWRETITKKYGIVNHSVALDEFKGHIIAQGKELNVMEQSLSEFKAYFANSARMGVFSEKTKQMPKAKAKRKPCEFLTQRTGQGVIGVIKQDGQTYFVPQEVGYPPTEFHFWNPEHRQYEIQQL